MAATVLIVLPWLNPFSPGPTPAVVPWMFSWSCVAALLITTCFSSHQIDRQRYGEAIATAWLVASLLSALVGLLQYFGQTPTLLSPWFNTASTGEAFGNLRQRNHFATLCSIGLLALLWRAARGAPARGVLTSMRWLLWGLGALLLACANAASGSRTGFLQWWLVAGLGLWWWWQSGRPEEKRKEPQARAAVLAVVALALYLVSLWLLPRVLEITTGFTSDGLLGRFKDETGCSSRRILWSNVLHLIAQKPWLGWGWGELGFAHFVTLYPGERFCDILDNAHNLPLHLAVELGVPFALVVCSLLVGLVWRAKPWHEQSPIRQLAWCVLVVIALHSLVEYPLWYGPFQMAVGLCVWLLWTTASAPVAPMVERPSEKTLLPNTPAALVFTISVATALIVFLSFSAWSYWRVSQLYLSQSERAAVYRDDTMNKVRGTWLFQSPVQFAELTTTPLAADNAAHLHALAQQLLHFSPEPRVAEKLIESAVMLGRDDVAAYYLQRYKAAFPKEHAHWKGPLPGDKTP